MRDKKIPSLYPAVSFLVLVSLLGFLFSSFYNMDYHWDFSFLPQYLWDQETNRPGSILYGLWETLWISVVSIVMGSVLGFFIGLLLLTKEKFSRFAAVVYVDIFRNTPVLVQLYVAFFVVGTAIDLSARQAGVVTLSLFCSAYVAEIVRGTLANFEKGQIDAAKSLGFTPVQIAYHVVAPQALKRMLPPLVGQFVSLVKDSSLVSVIGIAELTKSASNIAAVTFRTLEVWFFVAVLYLCLNLVLSTFGRYLEHRLIR